MTPRQTHNRVIKELLRVTQDTLHRLVDSRRILSPLDIHEYTNELPGLWRDTAANIYMETLRGYK